MEVVKLIAEIIALAAATVSLVAAIIEIRTKTVCAPRGARPRNALPKRPQAPFSPVALAYVTAVFGFALVLVGSVYSSLLALLFGGFIALYGLLLAIPAHHDAHNRNRDSTTS